MSACLLTLLTCPSLLSIFPHVFPSLCITIHLCCWPSSLCELSHSESDCGHPPQFLNSVANYTRSTPGSTVTYACYTGYSTPSVAPVVSTCTATQAWSAVTVNCQGKRLERFFSMWSASLCVKPRRWFCLQYRVWNRVEKRHSLRRLWRPFCCFEQYNPRSSLRCQLHAHALEMIHLRTLLLIFIWQTPSFRNFLANFGLPARSHWLQGATCCIFLLPCPHFRTDMIDSQNSCSLLVALSSFWSWV